MADTFVWRDGQRLTPWMFYIITLLDRDLFAAFGVHVIVSSAIRTYVEQERIFRERYVTAGNVNGRYVYDTRVWNGVRWYRISAAGTVAVPGTSNHEIQGSKAAVDLRDTGADGGIATAGSVRSNWLRARAHLYGMIASGFGFGEAWHYDIINIYNTPPGDDMGTIDSTAANKQVIKDAIFEFMRDTGPTVNGQPWAFMGSVWHQDIQSQDAKGLPQKDANGKPITFRAWGFLSSTNAQVTDIRRNGVPVTMTPDAIKTLGAQISKALEGQVGGATPEQVTQIVVEALGRLSISLEQTSA